MILGVCIHILEVKNYRLEQEKKIKKKICSRCCNPLRTRFRNFSIFNICYFEKKVPTLGSFFVDSHVTNPIHGPKHTIFDEMKIL